MSLTGDKNNSLIHTEYSFNFGQGQFLYDPACRVKKQSENYVYIDLLSPGYRLFRELFFSTLHHWRLAVGMLYGYIFCAKRKKSSAGISQSRIHLKNSLFTSKIL